MFADDIQGLLLHNLNVWIHTSFSLPVFLTELCYPVTGSGDEVAGSGDGHTDKIWSKEGL